MKNTTKQRSRKPRATFLKVNIGSYRQAIFAIKTLARPQETRDVLDYFIAYANYGNVIDYGTQADLAKLLGIHRQNISTAFNNLHQLGVLIKYNGKYRLDKSFAWAGDNRLTTAQIKAWNLNNQ